MFAQVTIKVERAEGLTLGDLGLNVNSYVKIEPKGAKRARQMTSIIPNDANPIWNASMTFTSEFPDTDSFFVRVIHKEGDKLIAVAAKVELHVKDLLANGLNSSMDVPLAMRKSVGALHLSFVCQTWTRKEKPGKTKGVALPRVMYKVCAKFIKAVGIEHDSDVYAEAQVRGMNESVCTAASDGEWNEQVELDVYYLGSDVVDVYVKEKREGGDRIIGCGGVVVRSLPGGVPKAISIGINREGEEGDCGSVQCVFHVTRIGDIPMTEMPWNVPWYTLRVKYVGCVGIDGKNPDGTSDAYLETCVGPALNAQTQKTVVVDRTTNPNWDEEKRYLLNDYKTDILTVRLKDEDLIGRDEIISQSIIVLGEFPINKWNTVERRLDRVGITVKPGRLHMEICIDCDTHEKEGVRRGEGEEEFTFKWGEYGSSYSNNFTGYSTCSESLSSVHEGSDECHDHEGVPQVTLASKKKRSVFVKIIGGHGLLQFEGKERAEHSLDVRLVGKTGVRKAPREEGKDRDVRRLTTEWMRGSDVEWNREWDCGMVRKGDVIEFALCVKSWKGNVIELATARKLVKDMDWDNEEIQTVQLEQSVNTGLTRRLMREYGFNRSIQFGYVHAVLTQRHVA